MSNLLTAIAARKVDICDVSTRVTGTLAETPTRFAAVEVLVSAHGPVDQFERLVEISDRGAS